MLSIDFIFSLSPTQNEPIEIKAQVRRNLRQAGLPELPKLTDYLYSQISIKTAYKMHTVIIEVLR